MKDTHTLELLRKQLDITKKEFASKLGITQNAYTNYINGKRNIPTDLALKIKQMFDIDLDWLLTGKGNMYLSDNYEDENNEDIVEVNYYPEIIASAGFGAKNYKIEPQRVKLSRFLLDSFNIINKNNIELINIFGDSMEPVYQNGDIAVIERVDDIYMIKNGNTIIANIDGDIFIKKIEKIPFENKLILKSTNPIYKDIVLTDKELETVKIIGIVRGKLRTI